MFEGLRSAALPSQMVVGIAVLKTTDEAFIELPANENMASAILFYRYHERGYAQKTDELLGFMNNFYNSTGIPLDFVYTGKLMKAVIDLVEKQFFLPQSKVLVIHSGGLQGNASLPLGTLVFV
jgi:1-aminocyclopropane-1-carboxylate deaminase/D-cysteine desulfhydrase-like pyridoxal-dependent ACC family enzyme